jgi:hypothetical protein
VLLLYPGGLTVFSGTAPSALPYFANLGFRLPANDNPADFFMDVISGQSPRFASPDAEHPMKFEPIELTEDWKQHVANVANNTVSLPSSTQKKRYLFGPIQLGLLTRFFTEADSNSNGLDSDEIATVLRQLRVSPESEVINNKQTRALNSFLETERKKAVDTNGVDRLTMDELLDWVRDCEDVPKDVTLANSEPTTPIQKRTAPSVFSQFKVFLVRGSEKAVRNLKVFQFDLISIITAAAIAGILNGTDYNKETVQVDLMMMVMMLGTFSMAGALPVFGNDRLIFWRESAGGVNTTAYFIANVILDLPFVLIKTCVFVWIYYALTRFPIGLEVNLHIIMFALCWVTSGWGYVFSIVLDRQNATLTAVVFALLIGAFLSGVDPPVEPGSATTIILFAYPTLEAATVTIWNQLPQLLSDASFNSVGGVIGFGGCTTTPCTSSSDTSIGRLAAQTPGEAYMGPVVVLLVQGLILRVLAGLLLTWTARDQQIKPRLSEVLFPASK